MKASRRIYLLKQLKRVGIDRKSDSILLCAHKFVLEYACQAHVILECKTVVFGRFRRARSAVSVITECEAREPHTPAGRVWRENDCRHFIQRIRKKRGSYNVTEVTEIA